MSFCACAAVTSNSSQTDSSSPDGVFFLHEIPENQANLIQGIEGIQIADARGVWAR